MKIKISNYIICFILLFSSSNGVFAEGVSKADKPEVERITFIKKDGSILFRSNGGGFAKDKLLPVIAYATNSEGSLLGLAVMVACPFVKINPAILDFTEAGSESYGIGYQESESGSHVASLSVKNHDLFYMNEEYLLKPEGKTKKTSMMDKVSSFFGWSSKKGPVIELMFYKKGSKKTPLEDGAISIKVKNKEKKELDVDVVEGNRFTVSNVPRETLEITISNKKTGKTSLYKLYPQFRATETGFIEYAVTLNNLQ